MMRHIIGLDFCGTFFARQSLSDLSYFALLGRSFNDVPTFLKKPRISKVMQGFFLLCTTEAKRVRAIREYTLRYGKEINNLLVEQYFLSKSNNEVFIASGSILELIQEVCSLNGISCPIIAASAFGSFGDRFHDFFKEPWTGATKVKKIIERYPFVGEGIKLHTFETDSPIDRPVQSIAVNYREINTSERFHFNN